MSNPEYSPPNSGRQHKITEHHLKRLAYVYIRQSTPKQVLHNRESQLNQYQLVQRAEKLGWKHERIHVIDADQGISARDSESRSGFKELVAEISMGHVGVIFGYEVSRLARNNGDWYHLLDLAAVFGTLIADNDGVYDPRLYNDRLLLGLKGTMSEAELHLLRQRLDAGRMSQVHRGEYRQALPTGLARLPDGSVIKNPDEQIQHVIELVFIKFEELGSCQRALRYLRKENILLPRRQTNGVHVGELLWKPPSDAVIYDMIRNPAYAGAFAYGRRQTDPTRRIPGKPATGRIYRPMDEWLHLQQDVYPAYISWEQYLTNQERLHQNAKRYAQLTQRAQGAAGAGTALLQGLVTCGVCGYMMKVSYKHSPRYLCNGLTKRFAEGSCMNLHAPSIDEAVVQAFFDAIRPAQLDALEAILETQQAEGERLSQQWSDRLKRVLYEAHLAERQYNAVEPENRLVIASLERNWEEKLVQLQETQEAYERFQQTPPPSGFTPQLREQFQHISERLPELWTELSSAQKKELLRCLISRVILKREKPDTVEVKIVWISGHYSLVYAYPPIKRQQDVTNYDKMSERISSLWRQGFSDKQIAAKLSSEGYRSARSLSVSPQTVLKIRHKHGWHFTRQRRELPKVDGYLTTRELATLLGVGRAWVSRRINNGTIDSSYMARYPKGNMHLIQNDPKLIEQLRQLISEHRST
jgi:DNA invertase Pin-like site-specific DNA recombinase